MVRIKHRYLLVEILYPNVPSLPDTSRIKTLSGQSAFGKGAAQDDKQASLQRPRSTLVTVLPPQLAFHIPTPDGVTAPALLRLLRAELTDLFGDYGAGAAGASLSIKYWSNATSTVILRCDRAAFRLVWAACTAIKTIPVQSSSTSAAAGRHAGSKNEQRLSCVFRVLRVSGTIRKCEEEAIKRAISLCGRAKGLDAVLDAGLLSKGLDLENSDELEVQAVATNIQAADSVDVSDLDDENDTDEEMKE